MNRGKAEKQGLSVSVHAQAIWRDCGRATFTVTDVWSLYTQTVNVELSFSICHNSCGWLEPLEYSAI